MRKSLIKSFAFLIGLVVFLIGCQSNSVDNAGEDGNESQSDATLNVLTVQDPFYEPLQKLIPEFEEETGIKVNFEGVQYDGMRNKVTLDAVGGSGSYDVFSIDNMWIGEFSQAGYLVQLDKLIEEDKEEINPSDIPQPLWDNWSWKGETFSVPFSPYSKMTIYRKDLWEDPDNQKEFEDRYGYELGDPQTWDEFKDIAEFFTGEWSDGEQHYGVAFNGKRGASIVHHFFAYANTFGAKWFKSYPEEPWDFTPTLNSPEMIEALEFYVSLKDHAPPEVTSFEWFDTGGAFWNGQVAMINHWSVYASMASDPESSKVVGNVGAFLPPGKDASLQASQLGGYGLGISESSNNKDAAWEFIKWATSEDTMMKMVKDNSFDAVSRVSVLSDPEVQEKYPWAETTIETYNEANIDYTPRIPVYAQMEEVLGVKLNDALTGEKSPSEALNEAQSDIEQIIEDAGLN